MNAGSPCGDGGKPNNFALPCSRNRSAMTIRITLSVSGVYFSTRSGFIGGSRDSQIDRANLSKDLWFPARMSDHGGLNRREHGSSSTPVPTLALRRRKPPSARENVVEEDPDNSDAPNLVA